MKHSFLKTALFLLCFILHQNLAPASSQSSGCEGNILRNWSFNQGVIPGAMPTAQTSNWTLAYGTPDVGFADTAGAGGCGDSGYVGMWGNQVVGEALQQTLETPLVKNATYTVSLCARWLVNPNEPYLPRVVIRASNSTLTGPGDGVVIGVTDVITNQSPGWATYTIPNWVATDAYSIITVSVTNQSSFDDGDSVTAANIDRVCIHQIQTEVGECEGNILQNWSFNQGVIPGAMPTAQTAHWTLAYGTPDVGISDSAGAGGCGDSGYVGMWGNQVVGEALQQTLETPLVKNATYAVSLCARWLVNPNEPYLPRVVIRASNSTLTGPGDGVVIGVTDVIANQSPDWATFTIPNWVATDAYSIITVSVTNQSSFDDGDSITAANIDRVCIHRVGGTITGVKYKVVTDDCVKDTTEPGLPGWTIHITGPETLSTVTNELGGYSFNSLLPGSYTVTEVQQPGWTQSCPVSGSWTLDITESQTFTGVDFGNKPDCIPAPSDLVGWWTMDESNGTIAKDITSGMNGIIYFNSDGQTFIPGKVDGGFQFGKDNSMNYVEVQDNPKLNFGTTGDFTIDAWVKLPGGKRAKNGIGNSSNKVQKAADIFNKYSQGQGGGYAFQVGSNNYLNLELDGGGTNFISFQTAEPIGGEWTFVAVRVNRGAGVTFFVNGEPVAMQGNNGATDNINVDNNNIATMGDVYQQLNFNMDEVEVFSRALDNTEIYNIFYYGKCKDSISTLAETHTYRTIPADTSLATKATKLSYDKKKGVLKIAPNTATAVEETFTKLGKTGATFLGVPQTKSDSVKRYGWITYTKAADLGKLYTGAHDTSLAFPIDSLRSVTTGIAKPKKMLSKAIKADRKTYNNYAWEQGVAFKLNLLASDSGITPKGLGNLLLVIDANLAGKNLKGKSLHAISKYFDSAMTYWKRYGIDSAKDYTELKSFINAVIKPINKGFYAHIDSGNYTVDSLAIVKGSPASKNKKDPYAVTLKGVKTAAQVGIVFDAPDSKGEPQHFGTNEENIPSIFALLQNYPNPFNPATVIRYALPVNSIVSLKIYNVLGQQVAALINNETMDAGEHEIEFNASALSSGVYFYRLNVNNEHGGSVFTQTKKLMLLK